MLRERGVTGRDAAFVTELVSGTIRRQGTYDAVIGACADRPLAKVDPGVLDALRLGRPPAARHARPHARRRVDHGGAGPRARRPRTGGIRQRRAAQGRRPRPPRLDPPGRPGPGPATRSASPPWPTRIRGGSSRPSRRRSGTPPAWRTCWRPTTLRRRSPWSRGRVWPRVEELVAAGGTASEQSPYAVELGAGDPAAVPAVAEGRAGVQDEGSQLVALALARAGVEGRDAQWLDLCAGPGGKSALLAALAADAARTCWPRSGRCTAPGWYDGRRPARGAGLTGVITADGTRPAWAPGSFDRVLVDAPCSGLGALRRRPESRWRRTPADLEQPGAAAGAAAAVGPRRGPAGRCRRLRDLLPGPRRDRPGSWIGCSPTVADVVLEDAAPLFEGVRDLRADEARLPGTVQLWPHRQGTDAMFFALLRKRER